MQWESTYLFTHSMKNLYLTDRHSINDHIFLGPPKRHRHVIQCESTLWHWHRKFYCNAGQRKTRRFTMFFSVWKMKTRESRMQKHVKACSNCLFEMLFLHADCKHPFKVSSLSQAIQALKPEPQLQCSSSSSRSVGLPWACSWSAFEFAGNASAEAGINDGKMHSSFCLYYLSLLIWFVKRSRELPLCCSSKASATAGEPQNLTEL